MAQKIVCPHCNQGINLTVTKAKSKEPEEKIEKKDELMDAKQFAIWCAKSPQRHIRIIGEWAETQGNPFTKKSQWQVYLRANVAHARKLAEFDDEIIGKAFGLIKKDMKNGMSYQPSLSTILKKLTN